MSNLSEYDPGPTKRAREEVIEKLKEHYALDNLDFDVFEKRLEIATNTKSRNELFALLEDLPQITGTKPLSRQDSQTYLVNTGKVREDDFFFALLSGTERKGIWKPPKNLKIATVMGGIDLDYTQAEIPPGVSYIEVFALMGGVDIKVPEGVNVEMAGIPILGGITNKAHDNGSPDAPTIRIRAFVIMGGIDVTVKRKKDKREKRRGDLLDY